MSDAFVNQETPTPGADTLWREVQRLTGALEREHALFQAIFEHSPHGIIICDASGRVTLQNPAAARIWAGNGPDGTVADWPRYRAFHPDRRPFEASDWSLARCLKERRVIGAEEVHIQRLDDTPAVLLGTTVPLLGEGDDLQGGIWVFADITPVKGAGERLRAITNALPALIAFVGADERYELANEAYERWFGMRPNQVVGRIVRDVVGERAWAEIKGYVRRALAGETVRFEAYVDYQPSGIRWVEANYIPQRRADGVVQGFVALVTDASARKDLEASREAGLERLRVLATVSRRFAEAASDLPTLLAAIVQETAAHLGETAEIHLVEGMAPPPPDAPPPSPEERSRTEALARRVIASDESLLVNEPFPGASLIVAPLRAEGQVIGAISCRRPPDRRRFDSDDLRMLETFADRAAIAIENARLIAQVERARAESELLYRLTDAINRVPSVEDLFVPALDTAEQLLGADRLAILLYDGEGVLRFKASRGLSDRFRRAIEDRFPRKLDERVGEPLVTADVASAPEHATRRDTFAAERIRGLALIPLAHEGRLLGQLMICAAVPRAFSERELRTAQIVAYQVGSVVGRMLAQRDRERLVDELARALKLSETFSAIVGHDLRNPLFAIINTAESGLRRIADQQALRKFNRIVSSGRRMNRMIDQLLDFTRVRLAGRMPVAPALTDAAAVFEDAIEEITTERPESRIELVREGDSAGVWDADRLAQLASNLIGNAVRHGTPGGAVRVFLDGRDPRRLVCAIRNPGHVPPGLVPHVFDPFRRGDDRHSAEGLGLGLYIAQQIVAAHGGTIDLRSTVEEGTTVSFTLPR